MCPHPFRCRYNGLTFATIRNAGDIFPPNSVSTFQSQVTVVAGHMVGGTQPERALAMFQRFINGEEL